MNFFSLLALFLLVNVSFGQNYVDSLRLLCQVPLQADLDSVDQQILVATLDSLADLTYSQNDSALLDLCIELNYQINKPEVGLPFVLFTERFVKRILQTDPPSEFSPHYQTILLRALSRKTYYYDVLADRVNGLASKIDLLSFAEQFEDTGRIIFSLQSIGFSYFNLQDYQNAGERFFRAYDLAQQAFGDSIPVTTYYSLFEYFIATDSTEQAITTFGELTVQQARNEQNPYYEGLIYRGLAYYYYKQNQYQTCYLYAKKALELFEEHNETYWIGPMAYRLVSTCINLGDLAEALIYFDKLAIITRKENTPRAWSLYHESAYEYYKAKGNYQLALQNYAAHIDILDSLNSASVKQQMYDQQYEYEYRQKSLTDSLTYARELALQAAETRRGRTISYFLIALLAMIGLFGLILWNRFRLTRRQNQIIEAEKIKLDVANAKLRELDNFKSRFFTNISHEFRTPLTVIGGMIKQIKTNPQKWLEKGSELIEMNVHNLLSLINQILDLRKLESGSLSLSMVQAEVVFFLRSRTEAFQSMAQDKGVSLTFQARMTELLMDFDPDKLLTIQSNLISNAIKFTPAGGQVVVGIAQQEPNEFLLEVADTGIGIPPNKLPFIFDRFYQVDGSPTREGEGTGIGLSLTKELVQFMGGTITVESTPEVGSTFRVSLPITQKALPQQPDLAYEVPLVIPRDTPTAIPQSTISQAEELPSLLVIEDNPDVITYLYACLEDSYQLLLARNGAEGVALALEQVPDLIISDVMMPQKNGYEVTYTLKSDERTSHIPIILLTAKADRDSRLEGLGKGADAYLTKPFDEKELFIRLEQLMTLRRRLQARYAASPTKAPQQEVEFQMEDAFIQKIKTTVLSQLEDTAYRNEDLCKDLGISRTQLHNKVKALTGKTPSHFLRTIRIEQAKELMRTSDIRIAEVAYAVGYGDPAYFTRVFTKETGISPSEWRED